MHIYFVRHGETLHNRDHKHQSPNTPLSPTGREEAVTAGEALRGVNATLLLSSEYTRTKETARIIGFHTGLTPVTNGLFYEIVRPSKFYDRSIWSFETLWYVLLSLVHRNNPAWRYADAENLTDITTRAHRAVTYLETLRDTHDAVIVVSHTVFINIMVSVLCREQAFRLWELVRAFLSIERLKNGGIIHVEYVGGNTAGTCSWRVVSGV